MAHGSEYMRLPGRGGSFYKQSLWLGPDHLLSVTNRGYSEDYKRFYYRDVRAIQIRRTSAYAVINVVCGAFLMICVVVQLLGAFLWGWTEGAQVAFALCTGLFATLCLVNVLLGPTCAVHLYTAVHNESMPSLNRLRSADKATRLLRAKIESVQGALTRESVLQNAGALDSTTAPDVAPPVVVEPYNGNFHWSLFALLLFNSILIVVGAFYRNPMLQIVNTVVYLAMGICMIGALIRQRKSSMGKGLRRLAWASTVYIWFVSVLGSFVAMFILFEKGLRPGHYDYRDVLRAALDRVPSDSIPLLVLALFSAACSLAIGLAGFVLMMQYRRENR